jgi:arylsulfatase A-like enzyme/tetratricopeptide (TPR) repeat protein
VPRQSRHRSWRLFWGVLAVAALAGAAWLGRWANPQPRAGVSVLLVTVDTLRADALGSYGRPNAGTPWMDRLAGEGVRFANAHAHNVTTLASHANILSGRLPTDHGVRDNSGFRFPEHAATLATLLRARGYRTGAFVSAFPLDSRFGLARGFDVYEDSFVDAMARPAFLEQERPAADTVRLARRWIEAAGDAPWFCWVHLYEPHFPYAPPEPLASRYRDQPYQGEVAAADAALAPLLETLLTRETGARPWIVLTSDHGESLGEHGEATHGVFAYEATLRVPLVLHQPSLLRPRVVTAAARHVDILPTVLDALSVPVPAGLAGRSLLPAAAGEALEDQPTYFEALSGQLNRGWAPLYGVIRAGEKLVELPVPELYDLTSDPRETTNLAPTHPDRLEARRRDLAPYRAADQGARPTVESAETRERLRALGYTPLGPAPARAAYGPDDDPKRLIGLDAEMERIVGAWLGGDLPAALARSRDLVRRRPAMRVALLQLAHLERESGNQRAAINALRRALRLDPRDDVAAALLGAYLVQAGQPDEALAALAPLAAKAPPDVEVLTVWALALARLGRTAEALAAIERAEEVDPSSAAVVVHRGTVHLMAGERPAARADFEAALGKSLANARALSSLAMMDAEDGDRPAALTRWKAAVAADPGEYAKLLALGGLLLRQGRAAEARAYLEVFAEGAPASQYAREIASVRGWLAAGEIPTGVVGPSPALPGRD